VHDAGSITIKTIYSTLRLLESYAESYLGEPVLVKLYRPRDGQKEFPGRLVRYEDGAVTIEMRGREVTFDKAEVALVRLRVEF
jgi:ribosome maturation factor RimP